MNRDQIFGRLAQVKGRAKSLVGNAVGSARLQREGFTDRNSGVVRAAFGDAKRATQTRIRELMRRIRVQS